MNHAADNECGAGSPREHEQSVQTPRAADTCFRCTCARSDLVKTSAVLSSVWILRTSMLPCATYSRTFKSRRSICLER
eukprot:1969233-Pleurochrysis_carterae.AAC.1